MTNFEAGQTVQLTDTDIAAVYHSAGRGTVLRERNGRVRLQLHDGMLRTLDVPAEWVDLIL